MSYYPAIFILAIAGSFLFLHFYQYNKKQFIALSLATSIAFCVTIAPSVIEAVEYKHYEDGLREIMFENVKNYVKDSHIPPKTYTVEPKNKLGLITDEKHAW
jgi:hypothetical protein